MIVLRTLLAATSATVLFSTAAIGSAGATPMFRGSLAHSGVYDGSGAPAYAGVQWRARTGGAVRGSAVVDGRTVYVGSSDGRVYAFDARNGDTRWARDLGGAVSSTPAIAHGTVFAQTNDGRVVALRAGTGALMWSRRGGAPARWAWGHESGDVYASSPLIARGLVVIGGVDGNVYGLDESTGKLRWQFATGGRVRSSPALDGSTLFVGSMDGSVYALALATGKQVWRFDTQGRGLASGNFGYDRRSVQSSPAVGEGIVAVGSRDGNLYAIDEVRGTQRWRLNFNVYWVNASPAIENGRVYATNSDAQCVDAVDVKTGKEVWRYNAERNFFGSASIAGETVYAGDFAGRLHALDKSTGKERWRFVAEGSRFDATPTIAGDRLYVGANDGSVFALNLVRGDALKRAVYWDEAHAKATALPSHAALKDYFAARDYEVLDGDALARYLEARIADRSRGVIVFAMDDLPVAVTDGREHSLLRRYLAAGGKAVWPGLPPLIFPTDPKTGDRDLAQIDRGATAALIGVRHDVANFDNLTATVTPAGKHWNLYGWWLAGWSANHDAPSEVLGADEQGGASAWVRNYGGPPGTGFVRIPLRDVAAPTVATLGMLQVAAEYFPRPI